MELTLPSILIRVSAMYVIGLVIIRLSGKQSIGDLSTMDFIVTTILGDAFDTIIYGEQPIIMGVVYFVTIALIHVLVGFLASRNRLFFRLTNSLATLMIQNGMVQGDGLGDRADAAGGCCRQHERARGGQAGGSQGILAGTER